MTLLLRRTHIFFFFLFGSLACDGAAPQDAPFDGAQPPPDAEYDGIAADAGTPTGDVGLPGPGLGPSPVDGGFDAEAGPSSRDGAQVEADAPSGGADVRTPSFLDQPTGPLPASLDQLGIFKAFPDLAMVDERVIAFQPRYPAWTNGAEKYRLAFLPAGGKIDTTIRDAWDFPVGTLFLQTLIYRDPSTAGTPIETRLIRKETTSGEIHEQWQFYVYEWNSEGTAATLANIRLPGPRTVTVDGRQFTHVIPRKGDCWNCHVANKSVIIGFDQLRLNVKIGASAETQLDQVIAKGWLSARPTALIAEMGEEHLSKPRRWPICTPTAPTATTASRRASPVRAMTSSICDMIKSWRTRSTS